MDKLEILLLAFSTIFIAELGDKTQFAVLSLVLKTKNPFWVFLGASLSFILLSFLGAYLGGILTKFIPEGIFEKIGGILFIIIGIFMLIKG
ncbi:MAG TPA: TMEM165/GDT1 family protein [Dictyoglomaceae bacterium]|nr:TMEM165/GDT1 family protein [Dictyoglomaceae bacterium]HOL40118.1 TMEM165/GDT1 family protein [Dictyoglomaceae bacterium]HOP94626.1 TMEM165/GDT1 family protein [Dictyoglomaceae bacterium]HPP16666.1 TMEM165/GDT1 family protein [Dictyoglomaceae bacterium]HPU43338.1 TMEM165/GDT1 family protein [Dictyoglomaceae bacterium]